MIISPDDVRLVHTALEREALDEKRYATHFARHGDDFNFKYRFSVPFFFSRNPHLLLPLGFDEYRVFKRPSRQHPAKDGWDFLTHTYGIVPNAGAAYVYESIYRDRASGAWYMFEGLSRYDREDGGRRIHFVGPPSDKSRFDNVETWLERLTAAEATPDPEPHALWLPRLWTPSSQLEQAQALRDTVYPILRSLRNNGSSLRELHWRTLEELVAELLRERGLDIHLTPRARDGGRDIVARGCLVEGEPMEIAVEVKQRATVGLHDVQRAIYANSAYPAIMIATAGVFSAGVVKEVHKPSNRLRVSLKDGVALSQWVDAYRFRRRPSRRQPQ